MFRWFLDLPWPLLATLMVGIFAAAGLAGLSFTRRFVLPRAPVTTHENDVVANFLHAVLIIYGLSVALLAIAVWEKYIEVTRVVSSEAVAIGTFYRNTGGYPEPIRSRLRAEVRAYTNEIIHEAWPLQRRGRLPAGGVDRMDRLQGLLLPFEPATEGHKALHLQTLNAYDELIKSRRLRLDFVESGLPAPMWAVVLVGSVFALIPAFFFRLGSLRLHQLMLILLAGIMGLLIFLIAFYDRPLGGKHAISSEAYELIYQQLMED